MPQKKIKQYNLQKATIENETLLFEKEDGFNQALKNGFFLVKIPDYIDVAAADAFAKAFYKPKTKPEKTTDKYKGFCDLGPDIFNDPLMGFHQRKYQIEQFLLERRFWQSYYPKEIADTGEALCRLSTQIIKSVFKKINLPYALWDQASGGCTEQNGAYHFTFNHFRPGLDTVGLEAHQDDGFVTILRSIQPGLHILQDGEWLELMPEPDYFKINFGLTMQILTEQSDTPIQAVMHRVVQQKQKNGPERSSWGHFSSCQFGEAFDRGIYRWQKSGQLSFYAKARDHINQNDNYIYRDIEEPAQ